MGTPVRIMMTPTPQTMGSEMKLKTSRNAQNTKYTTGMRRFTYRRKDGQEHRGQHPSSPATQGIRGTSSISWEWGPSAGPSGSYTSALESNSWVDQLAELLRLSEQC